MDVVSRQTGSSQSRTVYCGKETKKVCSTNGTQRGAEGGRMVKIASECRQRARRTAEGGAIHVIHVCHCNHIALLGPHAVFPAEDSNELCLQDDLPQGPRRCCSHGRLTPAPIEPKSTHRLRGADGKAGVTGLPALG